jgi:formylglycine-generating enzyme required for sulfatase activity/calcineurin-like phosphoesterase family protein
LDVVNPTNISTDITLLHLSELHFKLKRKEKNKTFQRDIQKELVAAVKAHLEKHKPPDFVVVAGDIAFSGKKHEYDEAVYFFTKLKSILPAETQFLLVPGNHDVDRDQVDEVFSLHRIVIEDQVDKFLESKKQIKHFVNVKFRAFRDFCLQLNPSLYESKDDYFWVLKFPDKKVAFLGLNSAWASEGDNDRFNIALGYRQVMEALKQAEDIPNRIVLLHHSSFNWLKDMESGQSRIELFKKCALLLHSHTHADNALALKTPATESICLGSNASYTSEKEGFIGFQFLRIQFTEEDKGIRIIVWPYIFDDRRSGFIPDRQRWSDQYGKTYFILDTLKSKSEEKPSLSASLNIPGDYKKWVKQFHSILPVEQLTRKGEAILLSLPAVYISLETTNPFYKEKDEMQLQREKKSLLAISIKDSEKVMSEGSPTIDIEKLLGRVNCLLVRGNAGMGKTTLIKHLAYSLTHGTGSEALRGYLPVLVFLKDFWPVYQEQLPKKTQVNITFELLLEIYLEKSRCPLTMEIVKRYLSQNRALILLDGLDEVPESIRGDLVELVHRFQFEHSGNHCLLTSRPHGIEGSGLQCFGKYLRDIEPLDEKKSSDFIYKWFHAVSGQAEGFAGVNAADFISDIRMHEHAKVFTQNPLLLTALCIFYLVGGKRIPDQRADLYDRITSNLLHRRFHHPAEPEKVNQVREYLMHLAFTMQTRHIKSIDAFDSKELLKNKYPQKDDESAHDYKKSIDRMFDGIEPVCGLLNRLSSGEIEFNHLSFQEFLAAKHILDMDIDYRKYLEDSWWEETLLLLFGIMNLDMRKRSNETACEILTMHSQLRLQLLACKALRDFQPSKREDAAVNLAREKLCSIIHSGASLQERFEAGDILGSLGDTRIKPSPMVKVEAGEFTRGTNKYDWEKPIRQIYLDEFMMGKYPVTNEEFKEFVDEGGYGNKDYWTIEGWKWKEEEKISVPRFWHDGKWKRPNFPVVGISWYEATAYAKWLSQKTGENYGLPTEAQWEKAARGTNGMEYPWGNEFDKNLCNSDECGLNRTNSVGIFPAGTSPYGCYDMAGNVWEWCCDWYEENYYKKSPVKNPTGPSTGSHRVIKGGSWLFNAWYSRAACRNYVYPVFRDIHLGFRLVRSF